MIEPPHIHLVDDDPWVRSMVKEYLEDEGYRVTTANDGAQMRTVLKRTPANIVLLDVRLPGESGLDLARELRQTSDVPIIMLSEKDEVVDRVTGLEIGADDYIAKPFHLRELLARIRSLFRRSEATADGEGSEDNAVKNDDSRNLRFSGWVLNRQRQELFSADGEPVMLSTGEFNLLLAFAERPNRILSRDQLLDIVHNREATLFDRSIDVQIGRLRRKIEADPKRPALIKTVRGAGYVLTCSVSAD